MPAIDRRRFLTISAGIAATAALPHLAGAATPLHHWRGVALGAEASITLAHPEAVGLVDRALAEIRRLEGVFSLYRADSALTRLNADGHLAAPPFELLECLALCGRVHAASGGLFDPTIQPLWRHYAERHAIGGAPDHNALADALAPVGWDGVTFDSGAIHFRRPGMALSLNGVAQGVIADRVAALLAAEGLTDILVNTGEFRALGGDPRGGAWPVRLSEEQRLLPDVVPLRDMALASSAPRATSFDGAGRVGHILDPRTGRPTAAPWRLASVTAPTAGLADALSTAICLIGDRTAIDRLLGSFPEARLAHLS